MKIKDLTGLKEISDLKAAYTQAQEYSTLGGQSQTRASWLIAYYQLKVIKGYKPNEINVYEKVNLKYEKANEEFNNAYNNPRARNLNFVGSGNLSKSSSNARRRLNNKTASTAIKSCKMKLIKKIITWAGDGMTDNDLRQDIIMEISSNKDIVDDYKYSYWMQWNTPLIEVHADILLWCDKYTPKYVTNLIGYYLGKYWIESSKLLSA